MIIEINANDEPGSIKIDNQPKENIHYPIEFANKLVNILNKIAEQDEYEISWSAQVILINEDKKLTLGVW